MGDREFFAGSAIFPTWLLLRNVFEMVYSQSSLGSRNLPLAVLLVIGAFYPKPLPDVPGRHELC